MVVDINYVQHTLLFTCMQLGTIYELTYLVLLCKDFLARYSGYFIYALRVSRSAVETLFAQYKFLSGNKLDSV